MNEHFIQNERLGIPLPHLELDWEDYSEDTRESILLYWESIRGKIPDRIAELEKEINLKQQMLSEENDFQRSCQLNNEIAELASIINDLWIWFRTNQVLSDKNQ